LVEINLIINNITYLILYIDINIIIYFIMLIIIINIYYCFF